MRTDAMQRAIAMWAVGDRWDAVMQTLRAEGYTKTDCIRASVEILRLPLADAKRLVHESSVWHDRRDSDDELHDALIAEVGAESRPEKQ